MKRVRRTRTAPEQRVAELLVSLGARYRRNRSSLPGSPDFSNATKGWAVFVHGCFWHGHKDCKLAKLPKHNRGLWREKLAKNRERDARKKAELKALGLRVRTVWQCELAASSRVKRTLNRHIS